MDRALMAVLGGAVGCGVLLALAVLKNERSFTESLYAETPAESQPAARGRALAPPVSPEAQYPRPHARPLDLTGVERLPGIDRHPGEAAERRFPAHSRLP